MTTLQESDTTAQRRADAARAERRETFIPTVSQNLGDLGDVGSVLIDRMFDAVWTAEQLAKQPPLEAVDRKAGIHQLRTGLQNLFSVIVALPADAQAAALAAADETRLGECFDLTGAWDAFAQGHAAGQCKQLVGRLRDKYGDLSTWEKRSAAGSLADAQGPPPAIWGSGHNVLWSSGEPLLITAGVGAGKTTLAGLVLRARLFGGEVLGLPVAQLPPGKKILYLALDRPDQIVRSLARQFSADQFAEFEERVLLWKGALPCDAAEDADMLKDLADYHDAHVVIIDSLKDAVLGLAEDRIGAAYNDARKRLLGSGRELAELHHLTRRGEDYGSVWLNAGAGSVIRLSGKAGCQSATVTHVKQPAHTVGPLKVVHDRDGGEISLRSADVSRAPAAATGRKDSDTDLVAWVTGRGADGVTATDAAMFLYGSTERSDVERARRALDKHTGPGRDLFYIEGTRGGNDASRKPSRWIAIEEL